MKQRLLQCWVCGSGLIVLLTLAAVFLYIVDKGAPVLSAEFLLSYPKGTPLGTEGGIFPAIIGTLFTGAIAALCAGAASIMLAIYLTLYQERNAIYTAIHFLIQTLSGIPSIVLGLFGYSFFIMTLGLPRSVLSAGLTLSVMIVPFITLRAEKILREFPAGILAASLDLGVSPGYTMRHMILPDCRRELATTIALAAAYAMGATAPIMFTGTVLYYGHVPAITDPFMALPYHLYVLANEGYALPMAYGSAFVLVILLTAVNLFCHLLGKDR